MNWEMREGSALVTELPLGLVVVLEVLPELSRSEDEPPPKLLKPPEEEPPEDWA